MYSLKRGAISCYLDGSRMDLNLVTRFFETRVKYFKIMWKLTGCPQRRSMPMKEKLNSTSVENTKRGTYQYYLTVREILYNGTK